MRFSDAKTLLFSLLKKRDLIGLKNTVSAYINFCIEPLRMSSQPLLVQIEPTLYCNLKCKMCINPISQREKRHLRLEEFQKILKSIPSAKKINLTGAGEAFLNPEIFDMLLYAKSKGILIGLATNGILLEEEVCRKIISAGIDWLNISIDSTDEKMFEKIRGSSDLNNIINNLKCFMKMKSKAKFPEVSIWFVIMKDNLTELPKVIKLAKDIGIDRVSTQLQQYWGNKNNTPEAEGRNFHIHIKSILRDSKKIARQCKVKFRYVNVPDGTTKRACKWPWKACYITADGFVTPCCLHGTDPELINFGNIFKEKFENIWNNRFYQNFRQQLKSNSLPSICRDCPAYYDKLII